MIMKKVFQFLNDNKMELFILAGIIFIFGSFKIFNYSFSYDTDLIILDSKNIVDSWLGLGRYFLVFIKTLFCMYDNLFLINLLTYTNVFIYSALLIYFFNIGLEKHNILRDILCILILVTSPFFLEQYNFTLQSFEVSFSMILLVLSYITTYYYLFNKKLRYGLLTILLLLMIFGTYQSFINLYIIGVLISLYKLHDPSIKNNLINIMKTIILFVISLIGYLVLSKVIQQVFQISSTSYLTDMIMWNKQSIFMTLFGFLKDIVKTGLGVGKIINLAFIISYLIMFIFAIKNRKDKISFMYIIFLMISPFLLNIVTGSRVIFRSLFGLSIVSSFFFFESYDYHKIIKYLVLLCVVSQFINCFLLLYFDYQRYLNDVNISSKIYKDCGNSNDITVVIRGIEYTEENIKAYKGEVMGRSYFEWTIDSMNADRYRIHNFMKIHGYDAKLPTEEDYDRIGNILFENEYPNDGYYIKEDNICFVNLGN